MIGLPYPIEPEAPVCPEAPVAEGLLGDVPIRFFAAPDDCMAWPCIEDVWRAAGRPHLCGGILWLMILPARLVHTVAGDVLAVPVHTALEEIDEAVSAGTAPPSIRTDFITITNFLAMPVAVDAAPVWVN